MRTYLLSACVRVHSRVGKIASPQSGRGEDDHMPRPPPEPDTDDEVEFFPRLLPAKRALDDDPTPSPSTVVVCPPCADQTEPVAAAPARGARRMHVCDVCGYETKVATSLKKHMENRHDIGVVWHCCDQPNCEYKAKQAAGLKVHKAARHDIDVAWHYCDQPNCEYRTKQAVHLKVHKAGKHDIDAVWLYCGQPDCKFKTKFASTIKGHDASIHNIDVVWIYCDHPNCEFKTKEAGNLKKHKSSIHNIDVVWHYCDQPGCKCRFKKAYDIKRHKAFVHDVDVVWHYCDQPGCEFKTKQSTNLKQHKADVHDIDVAWYKCDADPDKCTFQCKQSCNLYSHIRSCHARVYAQRKKEQEERVRRALLDAGWQEHRLAETMPPVGFFRREKRIDFKCAKLESRDTWANIDFVLGVPNGFVFLEVDENQHKYGYGDHLSCDMKRMACVMESLAVETDYNLPCLYWLRYNPDAWRVGGALRTVRKVEREARLVAWLERFACVASFGIGYAFYNCEAEDEGSGDPGVLDVLGNDEYNKEYAEVVDNLMGLEVGETGDAE